LAFNFKTGFDEVRRLFLFVRWRHMSYGYHERDEPGPREQYQFSYSRHLYVDSGIASYFRRSGPESYDHR